MEDSRGQDLAISGVFSSRRGKGGTQCFVTKMGGGVAKQSLALKEWAVTAHVRE